MVRSYNEERHIRRLLDGLARQTVTDVEIVLVDSGSTDATAEIAAGYGAGVVHLRREEFSFGHSLNVGCRHARGDVLVLASAHVYPVYDDWLERLLSHFDNPDIALVYGSQRGNEITRYSEHQLFRAWFPAASNSNQVHPFCNNANAAIRRSVWERVPYDESLTGLEDVAWAKQVMTFGYRIAYDADAGIVHVHDQRLPEIFNRYRREAIAMKAIYPNGRFGLWDFCRLVSANVAADWRHAAREGVLWSNMADVPLFRLMQFWGTYRGYAQHGPVTEQLRERLYYPGAPHVDGLTTERQDARRIDYAAHQAEERGGRDV